MTSTVPAEDPPGKWLARAAIHHTLYGSGYPLAAIVTIMDVTAPWREDAPRHVGAITAECE